MIIYVITRGSYSDYSIEALFTDKAAAEAFVELGNKSGSLYNQYEIEEWEADKPQPVMAYAVRYSPDFQYDNVHRTGGYVGKSKLERMPVMNHLVDEIPVTSVRLVPGSDEYMGVAYGRSFEHAEKNLWDAIAKAKAEAAGL